MLSLIQHINEQASNEITVGNYTTTHFHMCGSAIKTMKKNSEVEGAEELTRLQDQFYKLEKKVMKSQGASEQQMDQAKTLYKQIMNKSKTAGIEKEVKDYMDQHLDSIIKGDPEPGFGMVNESKGLSAKASKSGININTLRKVYNRGVAAWKTGHRPGTTPQQWGMARVNAFIVKKKKGNLNHDKDLA